MTDPPLSFRCRPCRKLRYMSEVDLGDKVARGRIRQTLPAAVQRDIPRQ